MQKIPTDRKTLRHSRRATLDVSIPKENKNILTNQQKPKIPANKYLKERHSSTIYNNSVRPEQISPVDFECNEILEVISVPYKSNLNRELLLEPDQLLTPKGSSSFIQEVHGVQPPPPEYEPLEIEEVGEPSSLWKPENKDYVTSMIQKENEYMPNPFALQSIQTTLTENMRTILYDWMMEVSSEFTLKRETFHLAITYVDRFLSAHKGIKKEEFQLIGLVAMYIAAKVEEVYPPKISDWAKSADNGYTLASIKMMEKLVLNRLNWKIFPATIHNWANWLMNQWDRFVEYHFGCVNYNKLKDFEHLPPDEKKRQQKKFEKRMIVFKYSNQSAYKRFRECMQVLDLACLDSGILKLTPRTAAAGLLYLMISKYFYETQYTLLYYTGPDFQESAACLAINEFSNISLCFGDGETGPVALEDHTEAQNFENASVVQELFAGFVSSAAEIKNVEDIYEAVAFFHPFLEFEVVFELPLVCKVQSKAKLESHYEEFLAYQTHNINNVEFLSQQLRGKSVTNK